MMAEALGKTANQQRGFGAGNPYPRLAIDELLEAPEIALANLARDRLEGEKRRKSRGNGRIRRNSFELSVHHVVGNG
jgi:hypothetical protein